MLASEIFSKIPGQNLACKYNYNELIQVKYAILSQNINSSKLATWKTMSVTCMLPFPELSNINRD